MFNLERGPDDVISVGVHPECEGWAIALRPVVIVSGQDLDHLPWLRVFLQHRSVVLEECGRVVVDVLHNDGQGGRGRLGRDAVVDRQDFHLQRKTNKSRSRETRRKSKRTEESVEGVSFYARPPLRLPGSFNEGTRICTVAFIVRCIIEKSNRLASGNCLWKLLRRVEAGVSPI